MRQGEGAPRRRLWPVFLPLLLTVALAIIWTGLWFLAATAAETKIAGWREREAQVGRVYTCGKQIIGGFPFRIEVRCADPTVELRREDSPIALKAADLVVVAQVYQPTLLISEFTGPMTISGPEQRPSYVANWALAQSSVRGTPKAPERASMVVDRLSVDRVNGSGNGAGHQTVMTAERIELHGRLAGGSVTSDPVIDLALRLVSGMAPELHAFTARPVAAEITATLRGLADFSPKPWPVRFRELQARGGRIEITRARIQQGDTIAVSSGTLGLSDRGGLDGQIQVTIAGLENVVATLDLDRLTSRGRVGAAIGVLDSLVPGLGQAARANAGPGIIAGLRAMGQATTLEGKPATTLPLRFADGQVLLGPFPVGRIPLLF